MNFDAASPLHRPEQEDQYLRLDPEQADHLFGVGQSATPAMNVPDNHAFRELADSTSAAIMMHRGAHIIYCNRAAQRITGYRAEDLLRMDYWQLVHPSYRDRLIEGTRALLRGERLPEATQVRVQARGGAECWVELSARMVHFEGQPTILGTYVDITGLKRAEAEQRLLREQQDQVIEGSPVPTFVVNADHVVTQWNRACAAATGTPASQVVGTREAWRVFHAEARPLLADLVVNGASAEEVRTVFRGQGGTSSLIDGAMTAEVFFQHFGEAGRWMVLTAAPLRDARGRITGAIETLQDVTERKMAESALLTAQVELEQLVEKRTAQLAQANEQLEADVARRRQTQNELLRRNSELTDLNGKLQAAQEQLLQSEKMASVGQLAAGVAHEINNPIGYVHSNLGTLEKYLNDLFQVLAGYEAAEAEMPATTARAALATLKQGLDLQFLKEDIPSLMNESREGISRVRKIVQDLKDFSRVDSTQKWELASLARGLDSTLNIVANEIKYCADVVKEYGDVPDVECIASQINQVFMNLLVNAAHAIKDKRGTITIRTRMEDALHARVDISDNGCGIPAENLQRIFDPFFTTKPVGKGTGLGLSLSYGIAQKHGGRLLVESTPGQGTTFSLILPLRRKEEAGEELAPDPDAAALIPAPAPAPAR